MPDEIHSETLCNSKQVRISGWKCKCPVPRGGVAAGRPTVCAFEGSVASVEGAGLTVYIACGRVGADLKKLNCGISRFILNLQPLTPDTELLSHLM